MILHVDMDAFFASVEQLDDPSLRGRCVLVGGLSDRGVVAACSYEARKFGIHSAMPMFQARRKCPDAVIVPPQRGRYKELSGRIMATLSQFSPLVEPVSIDEAYLDITGCEKLQGNPEQVAAAVKTAVRAAVDLTCSVGAAPVKFLAKIASDLDKPDGLTVIRPERMMTFIDTLDVKKVPGVGPKMQARLRDMGIRHLGDVRAYPEDLLRRRLGKFGRRLRELSFGRDSARVIPSTAPKSVSSEETLAANTRDRRQLGRCLLKHAEDVARQLRRKRMRARTVILIVRHGDFSRVTRQSALARPSQSAEPIYHRVMKMLESYPLTRDVRLIGAGASGLLPAGTPVQMDMFAAGPESDRNWEKVDRAVDHITERFGRGVIRRASLEPK